MTSVHLRARDHSKTEREPVMQRTTTRVLAAAAIVGIAGAAADGAVVLNEVFFDVPSSSDGTFTGRNNGRAYVELRGVPGESVEGLSILVIEGDGAASGVIDDVIPLNGTVGTNGLFLRRDDMLDSGTAANPANNDFTNLQPPPESGTTIQSLDYGTENPSLTFALVSGFTGAATYDLDTDNDGTIDSTPWTAVLDSAGFRDAVTDRLYATALSGGPEFTESATAGADSLHAYFRDANGNPFAGTVAYSSDAPAGPFTFTELMTSAGEVVPVVGVTLTPGSSNPAVPEPAALSLVAAGGLTLLCRRCRR